MPTQLKSPFLFVIVLGAFGGLLSAFYQHWIRRDPASLPVSFLDYPLFACFGVLAATVMVFILVPIDRSDLPRLAAFALLAGFGWEPIVSNAPAVLRAEADRHFTNNVRASIEEFRAATDPAVDREQLRIAIASAKRIDSETLRASLYEDLQASRSDSRSPTGQSPVAEQNEPTGEEPAGIELEAEAVRPALEEGTSEFASTEPPPVHDLEPTESPGPSATKRDPLALEIKESLATLTQLLKPRSPSMELLPEVVDPLM